MQIGFQQLDACIRNSKTESVWKSSSCCNFTLQSKVLRPKCVKTATATRLNILKKKERQHSRSNHQPHGDMTTVWGQEQQVGTASRSPAFQSEGYEFYLTLILFPS